MQTRLQKLELLRKALVTATRILFPEVSIEKICVTVHIHRSPELFPEIDNTEFNEHRSDDTHWFTSKDERGDICIFN